MNIIVPSDVMLDFVTKHSSANFGSQATNIKCCLRGLSTRASATLVTEIQVGVGKYPKTYASFTKSSNIHFTYKAPNLTTKQSIVSNTHFLSTLVGMNLLLSLIINHT